MYLHNQLLVATHFVKHPHKTPSALQGPWYTPINTATLYSWQGFIPLPLATVK